MISVISDDSANMLKGRNEFVRSRDGRYLPAWMHYAYFPKYSGSNYKAFVS